MKDTLRLNIILCKEDGCWVARCPELDTLAADPDIETAWEDIVRVCRAHIACGLLDGKTLKDLMRPPPDNWLEIMAHHQKEGWVRMHVTPQLDHDIRVERWLAQDPQECGAEQV
jgi:hypothetical protein